MFRWLAAQILCCALMSSAHAITISYTSKADFLDAVPDAGLESFEDLALTGLNTDPIVTLPFTMTIEPLGPGQYAWMVSDEDRPVAGTGPTHGDQFIEAGTRTVSGAPFEITFFFTQPLNAFGIHVMDFGDLASTGQLLLGNDLGDQFIVAETPPALANGNILFFGMVNSELAFSSVTFTKTTMTDGIAIDEVYFGVRSDLAAVPEPAPIMLLAIGLVWLGVIRQRSVYVAARSR